MKLSILDITGASYAFNPGSRNIALSGMPASLNAANVWGIINTTKGVVIMDIENPQKGTTLVNSTTINLQYNTTAMSSTDKLSIRFDLPQTTP